MLVVNLLVFQSFLCAHVCNLITEYQEVLRGPLAPPRPPERDLPDALLHERTDPDAEVGGHDVRQAEAREAFELVDVELELLAVL